MKPENTLTGILLLLVAIICVLSSCSQSGKRPVGVKLVKTARAKVLGTNTITYVNFTPEQRGNYRSFDTVWVDLSKHQISDTSQYVTKAVLYLNL